MFDGYYPPLACKMFRYIFLFIAVVSSVAAGDLCTMTVSTDPIICPNDFQMITDNSDTEIDRRTEWVVKKYKWYAERCAKTDGVMWRQLSRATHDRVATLIGRYVGLKQGDLILDWACGCGVSMRFLQQTFNVRSVGVDITLGAIAYAKEHYKDDGLLFCHADGSVMNWLPTNSVDHVFSFGGLLHLPKSLICKTLNELIRIVRPGGVVWAGYIDSSETVKLMSSCEFQECHGVSTLVVSENELFHGYGMPKANARRRPHSLFWKKKGGDGQALKNPITFKKEMNAIKDKKDE